MTIPLYILIENEEISPECEIKNDDNKAIAIFKPKIVKVTSYYDMYQKQLYNVKFNIRSYQERIGQLKETLDDISLSFKKQFEYCKSINLKNAQEMPGNNINAILNENNKLRNKISDYSSIE